MIAENRDLKYEDHVRDQSIIGLSRNRSCTRVELEIQPETIVDASAHVLNGMFFFKYKKKIPY